MISMKRRLERVFSGAGVDRILIMNTASKDSSFLYLTGFEGGVFEGAVLLVRRESMTLFVSPLEYGMAKEKRPKEMEVVLLDKRGMLKAALRKELRGKKTGINGPSCHITLTRS